VEDALKRTFDDNVTLTIMSRDDNVRRLLECRTIFPKVA
jgi:hypothetical protein